MPNALQFHEVQNSILAKNSTTRPLSAAGANPKSGLITCVPAAVTFEIVVSGAAKRERRQVRQIENVVEVSLEANQRWVLAETECHLLGKAHIHVPVAGPVERVSSHAWWSRMSHRQNNWLLLTGSLNQSRRRHSNSRSRRGTFAGAPEPGPYPVGRVGAIVDAPFTSATDGTPITGVHGKPVCMVKMPFACQFPITFFIKPFPFGIRQAPRSLPAKTSRANQSPRDRILLWGRLGPFDSTRSPGPPRTRCPCSLTMYRPH